MKIKLNQAFKPLEIELGEPGEDGYAVVTGRIDLTDSAVNENLKMLLDAQGKAQALMIDYSKLEKKDSTELAAISAQLADIIADPIIREVGEKTYEEILVAAGGGERVPPQDANIIMTQVFAEIMKAVLDHVNSLKDNKAAHYLLEVSKNAQTKPNRAE
jgi:hypothetical protein